MRIMTRLVAVLFGTILVFSFFMPWLELDLVIAHKKVSGYELFKGVEKHESRMEKIENFKEKLKEKILRKKPEPESPVQVSKIYLLLLFPITGLVAILFSGFIRVPLLTLLTSVGTVCYFGYQYFGGSGGGGKMHEWVVSRLNVQPGMYLTLACMAIIIFNSFLQLIQGGKMAAQ